MDARSGSSPDDKASYWLVQNACMELGNNATVQSRDQNILYEGFEQLVVCIRFMVVGNRTCDFIDQYVPILIEDCSKKRPPIKSYIKVIVQFLHVVCYMQFALGFH